VKVDEDMVEGGTVVVVGVDVLVEGFASEVEEEVR
jgi:hypothetical protein